MKYDIKDVVPIALQDGDETYRFYFVESEYYDGKLFQIGYEPDYAEEVNIKPSMRGCLCIIGEDNKNPIPTDGWGYGKEPMVSSQILPRKPHFAMKPNFFKNPRKSIKIDFQFSPQVNWKKEGDLYARLNELYLQHRHPKLWNHPDLKIGMSVKNQSTGETEFTDFGRVHSNVIPFPKLKQEILSSLKGDA